MAMNPPRRRYEFKFDRLIPANSGPIGGDLITTEKPACGSCKQPYKNAVVDFTVLIHSGTVGRRLRIKCANCGNKLWWLWGPKTPDWMTRQYRHQYSSVAQEVQFSLKKTE